MSEDEATNSNKRRRSISPCADDAPTTNDAKRLKLDASSVPRHEKFYFDDGNVVLIAGPLEPVSVGKRMTSTGRAFRVHRSVLCRVSTVFSDMFALPPGDGAPPETYEGIPCVILAQDEVEDVESLISALYNGSEFLNFDSTSFGSNNISALEGALILSKKYMMDQLFNVIANYLERCWPQTLRQWDIKSAAETILQERWYDDDDYFASRLSFSEFYPDPGQIIPLARSVGLPRLLPSAFYDLSRIRKFWEDGLSDGDMGSNIRVVSWKGLDREDLWTLNMGKERILQFLSDDLPNDLSEYHKLEKDSDSDPASEKTRMVVCNKALSQFWTEVRRECITMRDPLWVLGQFEDTRVEGSEDSSLSSLAEGICDGCMHSVQTSVRKVRREFWDRLPEFFAIPLKERDWNDDLPHPYR